METQLANQEELGVSVWRDEEKIRRLFAKELNTDEFRFFMGLGQSLGANPFTREIWAIKYKKDAPASVFLGRDFHRRKAEEQENYDGHYAEAIYENDSFEVVNGEPHHKFNFKNRGKLIGAYAVAYRKGVKQPYFVSVQLREYDKGFSNWKTMPETMIKKVAEQQCLRGAWQGVFGGTYGEDEQWVEITEDGKVNKETGEIEDDPLGIDEIIEEKEKEKEEIEKKGVIVDIKAKLNKLVRLDLGDNVPSEVFNRRYDAYLEKYSEFKGRSISKDSELDGKSLAQLKVWRGKLSTAIKNAEKSMAQKKEEILEQVDNERDLFDE